jgi:hypothetical protein
MKKPIWTIIIGGAAVLFGILNGWTALLDFSQVQSWKYMNSLFAPAQQIIADQGAGAANFAFNMIAPPNWFIDAAVQSSWAGIVISVLFLAAAVGLFMYRRFGMRCLALALAANIFLQGLYAAQAVRSMSVQAIVVPARAVWIIALNILLLLVMGIGSLRWFRFVRPVAESAGPIP